MGRQSVLEISLIDEMGAAGKEDAVSVIVHGEFPSEKRDADVTALLTIAVFNGCNHGGTGAGPAGKRFAAAAFPYAQAEVMPVYHAHKLGIHALRKQRREFKFRPDPLQIQGVDPVAEYDAMRVPTDRQVIV